MDAELAQERDALAKLKKRREKMRVRQLAATKDTGFVGNDALVLDYERRKGAILTAEARIRELKERCALLEAGVAKNNAVIAARTVAAS